ncbi:MAG: hypothetical protein DMF19_12730 [Verrucomicrobia bacterium]|nr:MAG: hypothetical protein DMF19_12730 [Verrucomicrobiota bacterium]
MVTERPGRRTWRKIFLAKWWQRRRTHVVLLVWAAIYLPGLGSLEIRGEEGRRILPAVTMLQTGNYLVPHVGSEPYFRKPPLINWIAAASFKLTGVRSEWTARLPSALAILAVALTFVTRGRRALGTAGSLLAAMIWLVNAGNIEKGRLIEIEAIYVSLTALAFIFWIAAYRAEETGRRLWLLPAIFLGLAMLAKGPLPHLLFFYGPVLALLWNDRKLALLATRDHFIALVVMFGMFAAWALPAFLLSDWDRVAHIWSRQYTGRVSGSGFQFSSWIMNIPRGLVYFLPWLPLAFLQFEEPTELRRRHFALLLGIAAPFVLVNVIPGALPRYAMPALGPAAWWFGLRLDCRPIFAQTRKGSPTRSANRRHHSIERPALRRQPEIPAVFVLCARTRSLCQHDRATAGRYEIFPGAGRERNRSSDDEALVAEPGPAGLAHRRLPPTRGNSFFCSIPALILVDKPRQTPWLTGKSLAC